MPVRLPGLDGVFTPENGLNEYCGVVHGPDDAPLTRVADAASKDGRADLLSGVSSSKKLVKEMVAVLFTVTVAFENTAAPRLLDSTRARLISMQAPTR